MKTNFKPLTSQVEVIFTQEFTKNAERKADKVQLAAEQVSKSLFRDMAASMGGGTPAEVNGSWTSLSERWLDDKARRFARYPSLTPTSRDNNAFYWGVSAKSQSLRRWLGKRSVTRAFGRPSVKTKKSKGGSILIEIDLFPKVRKLADSGEALRALNSTSRGGAKKQVTKLKYNAETRPFLQPFMIHRAKIMLPQRLRKFL